VVTAITLQVVALILILAGAVLLTRPAAAAYVTTPGLRSDQEAGITRR
jgi:hypothetical protein